MSHDVATPSALLAEIHEIGRDSERGGYTRPVFSEPERQLTEWFVDQARRRGLDVETDGNGITWAWWDVPGGKRTDAIGSGSHLDSVPGGGAFDGPLGVVSALSAVDHLRARGVQPKRALAVMVFPEEEGSRFGLACLGSRLAAGVADPEYVRGLRDADGVSYAEASRAAGIDPSGIGADPHGFARLRSFVELHIEQGRGLAELDQPVSIGRSILGHGRWHLVITGRGDHAGTTRMADRQDPMVVAGEAIGIVRREALAVEGARGTIGRIRAVPGGTNVIASSVELWLDVRHFNDDQTLEIVRSIAKHVNTAAERDGCVFQITRESFSPTVQFHEGIREKIGAILPLAPMLDTGAGHDAGVLSTMLPTGMLYVRNMTGTSHSPLEHCDPEDADAGAVALADVLQGLLTED
ncbi:allantoate amidohydrolase [Pseudoclavibacter sp. CFCC 13611]|uniref:allantoate amidohydrolase n=1 Tax=Pseudoclavibacter sp. CFCC 13611 TaxID=2615178 RepID=UPI00130110A5|nr:allantoate amidohydrolase [Pseudoclavibacter sp. CFCC 13611]KAB1663921.1 allantoate amidohydrolase [Pseudoclavibacter sp. CFCC 13611]